MFGDDVMLIPRDGEMNYEKLDDLNFYYMFLGSCLSQNDYDILKQKWNSVGGVKTIPWWKFVAENVNVTLANKVPVVITYSFDKEATVIMCDSDETAEKTLAQNFAKEFEYDKENKYQSVAKIDADNRYAIIKNEINNDTHVTEFRIGTII